VGETPLSFALFKTEVSQVNQQLPNIFQMIALLRAHGFKITGPQSSASITDEYEFFGLKAGKKTRTIRFENFPILPEQSGFDITI
jgi:hypothetical protein